MASENKHVMIDVDQDFITTETEERSERKNNNDSDKKDEETDIDKKIDKNNKEINIKQIKFSDSSPDIMELLNTFEIDKNKQKDKDKDKKDKKNKKIKDDISLDTIDKLEYDELDDIESYIDNDLFNNEYDNITKKLINLKKKNQLKSKMFNEIILEKIKQSLKNEISDAALWRFTWAKIATAMFCISEVLMIIQTALSFTAASYQILLISYLAGVIGVVAIGLNRFGSYSKNQSSEKTTQLNKLLKAIGIEDALPDLIDDGKDKKKNDK
jgi:ABC-type Fe3+-siderophore transport system permease subunit